MLRYLALIGLLVLAFLGRVAIDANAAPGVTVPNSIVIVACRVDDLTGKPGRHDPDMAAGNWRDYEWHVDKGLELQCKREEVELSDGEAFKAAVPPLVPDFSNLVRCANVALSFSPKWQDQHPGWAVMAVGCPRPVVNRDPRGRETVIGYHLPECPSTINGMPVKCRFDESVI